MFPQKADSVGKRFRTHLRTKTNRVARTRAPTFVEEGAIKGYLRAIDEEARCPPPITIIGQLRVLPCVGKNFTCEALGLLQAW